MNVIVRSATVMGAGLALAIGSVVAIGATLPVAHIATRSQTFTIPRRRLWDVARAEFERSNDGTYAIVEDEPYARMMTKIINKNLPFGGTWSFHFTDATDGATLTMIEHGEVYNPVFRFISRYVIGHTRTLDTFFARLQTAVAESRKTYQGMG